MKYEDGTWDAKGNWVTFDANGKPQYAGIQEDANGNLIKEIHRDCKICGQQY